VIDERWQRIKALFQAAVERRAAERTAFLSAAAGDDEALRREVESLLASDTAEASFLDRVHEAGRAVLADAPAAVITSTRESQPRTISTLSIGSAATRSLPCSALARWARSIAPAYEAESRRRAQSTDRSVRA